jgi:hypothetical protein
MTEARPYIPPDAGFVILSVNPKADDPPDGLRAADRLMVVDLRTDDVWLTVDGPDMMDALACGVGRFLNHPATGDDLACFAPIRWISGANPDLAEALADIEASAQRMAHKLRGDRLQ